MLRIRQDQLHVFRESLAREFVERAMHNLELYWPARTARLGPAALREFVLATIDLSERYDFASEQHILRLANIRMALLPEPPEEIAWVHTTLEDSRFRPLDRLDQLSDATYAYLERKYGPWDS